MREALMNHLTRHLLIPKSQFGFIKQRSTVLQLLNYLDYCANIMVEVGCVDVLYLDYAKAFDIVPHRRLITKLESYEIGGSVLSWITDLLSGRRQIVTVDGAASQPVAVTSGIHQGSVLGSILFVVFINDLSDTIDSFSFLFADDSKVLKHIKSREDRFALQRDLATFQLQSDTWLLRFHASKCKILAQRSKLILSTHMLTYLTMSR